MKNSLIKLKYIIEIFGNFKFIKDIFENYL